MVNTKDLKIKKQGEDFFIQTPSGVGFFSQLTNKKDLIFALETSTAHQKMIEILSKATKTPIKSSNHLPSTEDNTFIIKAFYCSVKIVIENLVNLEEMELKEAIELGNQLVKGQQIIVNHPIILSQVKDALMYFKKIR